MKSILSQHHKFPVGMRLIKTVIAVFLCLTLDYVRGADSYYSVIAAILCMRSDHKEGFEKGVDRMFASLTGGIFALMVLYLFRWLNTNRIIEFAIISIVLIPLILLHVEAHRGGGAGLGAIVFVGLALRDPYHLPILAVYHRLLDTFLGIAVAVVINLLPPHYQENEEQKKNSSQNKFVPKLRKKLLNLNLF